MEGPIQLLPRETIKLDHSTTIPGSVVEKLVPHQLEGIRIIHRGLAQNNGFILNDESGLGKTHQVVGYLSASGDKSAIICSSLQRIHHWIYHIELLSELDFIVAGENSDYENHQIILATSENFHQLSKQVEIKLLVIDETKGTKFDAASLKTIASFTTAKKLFVWSTNLLDDLLEFSVRLKICRVQYFAEILRDFFDHILPSKRSPKKAHKLKLFFLTRSVYIRRFRSNYKRVLPLVEKSKFNSHFAAWRRAKGFEIEPDPTQTIAELTMDTNEAKKPDPEPLDGEELAIDAEEDASLNQALIGEDDNDVEVEAAAAAPLVQKESEPLFDFEASTEDMPHLVVESSDSESKLSTINVPEMPQVLPFIPGPSSRSPATNIEVPETESSSQKTEYQTDSEGYLEFGQALGCGNSESEISADTIIGKADQQPSMLEEKYNFPIDRFLRRKSSSSSEAQIVSKESVTKSSVVVVSSSSSNGAAREKSPDLFTDTEDELDETAKNDSIDDTLTKLLMKSPTYLDKTVAKPVPKFPKSNVSTPISKLIHAELQTTTGSSAAEASSDDMFADVTVRKAPDLNRTDVFEITDNAAFGNQIKVVGACMSPLQQDSESDVQFVSVVRQPDEPIEIVDLDTEVCTPKSQIGRSVHKTPSSTTGGSGGSTPRGWLTKGSRHSSDGGSPRTPTNSKRSVKCRRSDHGSGSGFKRKKLDNWFQDDEDRGADGERASTSANKRKSAPGGSGGGSRKVSPRKKCFQERVIHRINQILVSPTGFDSDFE